MKKLTLLFMAGFSFYFCLASSAQAAQLNFTKIGDKNFVIGSLLNQGGATIIFDDGLSSAIFQQAGMPTPIAFFASPTFRIAVPEGGFRNGQLRYGNTTGGCIFYFNSHTDQAMVSVNAVPYGAAQCRVVHNNFLINVLGPPGL